MLPLVSIVHVLVVVSAAGVVGVYVSVCWVVYIYRILLAIVPARWTTHPVCILVLYLMYVWETVVRSVARVLLSLLVCGWDREYTLLLLSPFVGVCVDTVCRHLLLLSC